MGIKRRKGLRASKVPIGPRRPEPGAPEADPCAATWEFGVEFSPQLASYITRGSHVSLHPKAGKIAIVIGTREIGILTHPAVRQILNCMNRGYVYTGSVIDVVEQASRVRLRVSGTRVDGRI